MQATQALASAERAKPLSVVVMWPRLLKWQHWSLLALSRAIRAMHSQLGLGGQLRSM